MSVHGTANNTKIKMIFRVFGILLCVSAITAAPVTVDSNEAPPKTDIGAFSVTGTGKVYLYYEPIDKHRTYVATALNEDIKFENTANAIKYDDVVDHDVTIYVSARNSKDQTSEFASHWRVPVASKRCAEPLNLKLLQKSDQIIEITWTAPHITPNTKDPDAIDYCPEITSYTVFWCESRTKQPNSCDGSIQFIRIRKDQFSHQVKTSKSLSFAVSANSHDSSSGMIWLNNA